MPQKREAEEEWGAMKRILLATSLLAALTNGASAQSRREDALVACRIGQAGVSLHKQMGTQVNARAATDIAMKYADQRCKDGRISEGGSDYVYHSIHGMAKAWFKE
jgi:hypothetical protein